MCVCVCVKERERAVEVGSRGFLNLEGLKSLFSTLENCSHNDECKFLRDVSRKAILESHRIWSSRNSST